jgi:hypothetical protein
MLNRLLCCIALLISTGSVSFAKPALERQEYSVRIIDVCAFIPYYTGVPVDTTVLAGCAASLNQGSPADHFPDYGPYNVIYSPDKYGIRIVAQSGDPQVYRSFYSAARYIPPVPEMLPGLFTHLTTGYIVDFPGHDVSHCTFAATMEGTTVTHLGLLEGVWWTQQVLVSTSTVFLEMASDHWGVPTAFSLIVLC